MLIYNIYIPHRYADLVCLLFVWTISFSSTISSIDVYPFKGDKKGLKFSRECMQIYSKVKPSVNFIQGYIQRASEVVLMDFHISLGHCDYNIISQGVTVQLSFFFL